MANKKHIFSCIHFIDSNLCAFIVDLRVKKERKKSDNSDGNSTLSVFRHTIGNIITSIDLKGSNITFTVYSLPLTMIKECTDNNLCRKLL